LGNRNGNLFSYAYRIEIFLRILAAKQSPRLPAWPNRGFPPMNCRSAILRFSHCSIARGIEFCGPVAASRRGSIRPETIIPTIRRVPQVVCTCSSARSACNPGCRFLGQLPSIWSNPRCSPRASRWENSLELHMDLQQRVPPAMRDVVRFVALKSSQTHKVPHPHLANLLILQEVLRAGNLVPNPILPPLEIY
jgi:hypothetical protein